MKTKYSKFKQALPKTVSAFLVVWLSSVLVLVCCTPHLFMASASNLVVEEEESCTFGQGHDCCKKKQGDGNSQSFSESEKEKADCCVFKPTKTLSTDLQKSKDFKQSPAVTEKIETPKPVYFIRQNYKPTKVYHSAIRNRGSTYLQNCVFRI